MNSQKGFEFLYKQFMAPLTRFVFKKIGSNPDIAEEIVAETMAAAWKGFKTFEYKSSFFTWICRIALNKIADYYKTQFNRNSGIVVPLLEEIAYSDPTKLSLEEKLVLNDLKKSVNDCLNLLPTEKRRLLQFRYWLDMSYDQIAKITGMSVRSIEGKIYRAKSEFAQVWHKSQT